MCELVETLRNKCCDKNWWDRDKLGVLRLNVVRFRQFVTLCHGVETVWKSSNDLWTGTSFKKAGKTKELKRRQNCIKRWAATNEWRYTARHRSRRQTNISSRPNRAVRPCSQWQFCKATEVLDPAKGCDPSPKIFFFNYRWTAGQIAMKHCKAAFGTSFALLFFGKKRPSQLKSWSYDVIKGTTLGEFFTEILFSKA